MIDDPSDVRTPRKADSSRIAADLLLILAWMAIGVASTLNDGAYTKEALLLVLAAVLALALAVATNASIWGSRQSQWGVLAAAALSAYVAVYFPAGIYGGGAFLTVSRGLTTVASTGLLLWILLGFRNRRLVAYLIILVMTTGGVAMIVSSPKPAIDVWYMLQAATKGLSGGHNFYTIQWNSHLPLEVSNRFGYLPGTALILWPFHTAFGDVRYGLLAATIGSALILTRLRSSNALIFVPCLLLLSPLELFGIEQSWVDPLLLFAVCVTAFLVVRDHPNWAVVTFAVALSSKQTAWLLLPLALFWRGFGWRRTLVASAAAGTFALPWVVASPHAFVKGVSYYVERADSLSVPAAALRHGVHLGFLFTLMFTAGAVVLAIWRLRMDAADFLLAAAFVLATFNLTGREAFFNEWSLASGLIVAALAFRAARRHPGPGDTHALAIRSSVNASSGGLAREMTPT